MGQSRLRARFARRRALFDSVDPDNPRAAGFARVRRRSRIVPDAPAFAPRMGNDEKSRARHRNADHDDEECRHGGPEMMSEARE